MREFDAIVRWMSAWFEYGHVVPTESNDASAEAVQAPETDVEQLLLALRNAVAARNVALDQKAPTPDPRWLSAYAQRRSQDVAVTSRSSGRVAVDVDKLMEIAALCGYLAPYALTRAAHVDNSAIVIARRTGTLSVAVAEKIAAVLGVEVADFTVAKSLE